MNVERDEEDTNRESNKKKIVIAFCGDPDSGKSILSTYLRKLLPFQYREFISANVDGEGVVGDSRNQALINTIKRRGRLSLALPQKVKAIIEKTELPIVIVDIGGLACFENAQILTCCDYCVIVTRDEEGKNRWRKFIDSLQPGKIVEYVERRGTPLKEGDIVDENCKVVKKDGVNYVVEDISLSKPYEEISIGGKSPKIIAEIDSRRSQKNPRAQNGVTKESDVVKAVVLDLERGCSDRISSKLLVEDEDVLIDAGMEYFEEPFRTICILFKEMFNSVKDLSLIMKNTTHRNKVFRGALTLTIIGFLKRYLEIFAVTSSRIEKNDDLFDGEHNSKDDVSMKSIFDECKKIIKKMLINLKPLFVFKDDRVDGDIIDFYRVVNLFGDIDNFKAWDLKKLILLYDVFLDENSKTSVGIYGSRLLLSTAAFVEEAKKDGISTIQVHSSTCGSYITCKKMKKSAGMHSGITVNGITYYYEKNEETKTVMVHMKFDDGLSPEDLEKVVLPDFPEDYKLYFSGIIPDWFIGSLSYSYDNKEKALFKPDAEGGTLITYASSDIGKIGLEESNPPGIDLAEFFSKIPNSPCIFVTRPTAEDSTQNTEEPEQDY